MRRISQDPIDRACQASAERYEELSPEDAGLRFAYEVQGFASYLLERGQSIEDVRAKTNQLFDMLKRANHQ